MNRLVSISVFVLGLAVLPAAAAEEPKLETENARINYSVGYQVGSDFRNQGVEIDPEIVARGIADAMSGAQPAMSSLEMRKELTDLQRRVTKARSATPETKDSTPSQ